MSTITLPADDPRGAKAVAIAANAGQFLKVRLRDGSKAYGVPSQCPARPGVYYLTTATACTCEDFRRHGLRRGRVGRGGAHGFCKHILAVRLTVQLLREQAADGSFSAPRKSDLRALLSSKPPLYQTNHLPERALCGMVDFRGRVCGLPHPHAGAHRFVPRTTRED